MNRRQFLAAATGATMTALSGCSSFGGTETPTPTPTPTPTSTPTATPTAIPTKYDPEDEEELLPDEVGEKWPDQDLVAKHDQSEDFDRVWRTPDGDIAILMSVAIYETVEKTKEEFERIEATTAEPGEYPLADEAIIHSTEEMAGVLFRDSNAMGYVMAGKISQLEQVPDRQRAAEYAEYWYDGWF